MNWWLWVGIVPIVAVIFFLIWEMTTYDEPPHDGTTHDPSRASWTSSAMQDEMHSDE